ncbi:hypothetical protein OAL60_00210 [bacterium]|nr:hypothetical protein [bacterium]
MKINKYIGTLLALSIIYLVSVEVAGDAKKLADINYIYNLGILEIGWKAIVTIKTILIGNSNASNIIFIYTIQLMGLAAIYDTARITNKKILTGLLLLTLLLPIALRIQIRLGIAVCIWINSVVKFSKDRQKKRYVITCLIASSLHQGVAALNIMLLCLKAGNWLKSVTKIPKIKKKHKSLIIIIILTCTILSGSWIINQTASLSAIAGKQLGHILPTINTLNAVIERQESFERTDISKYATLIYSSILLILGSWADKIQNINRKETTKGRQEWENNKQLEEIRFLFFTLALFNIVFAGIEYYGRIGGLSYILYALFIILINMEIGDKKLSKRADILYYVPIILGTWRFIS